MISSRANSHVKAARALGEAKERKRTGLFVDEGEDALRAALAAGIAPVEAFVHDYLRSDRIADELGDVAIALVNVARHTGTEAELAVRAAAGKFRRRFEAVEALAAERAIDMRAADLTTLDALWDDVKRAEPPTRF